jgi:hypothetical protein
LFVVVVSIFVGELATRYDMMDRKRLIMFLLRDTAYLASVIVAFSPLLGALLPPWSVVVGPPASIVVMVLANLVPRLILAVTLL